jgi:hypothetical protein
LRISRHPDKSLKANRVAAAYLRTNDFYATVRNVAPTRAKLEKGENAGSIDPQVTTFSRLAVLAPELFQFPPQGLPVDAVAGLL